MDEQEDLQNLADVVLSLAKVARETVVYTNLKIVEAIIDSPFNDAQVKELVMLAGLVMSGGDRTVVCELSHLSPELLPRLDKYEFAKW